MTEQLKDLERRLAEATGPSKELDYAIWRTFDEPTDPTSWQPQYSYSIDSAVGLASRVLPGWALELHRHEKPIPDMTWGAHLVKDAMTRVGALSDYPALALCTAIVRALMQKEE